MPQKTTYKYQVFDPKTGRLIIEDGGWRTKQRAEQEAQGMRQEVSDTPEENCSWPEYHILTSGGKIVATSYPGIDGIVIPATL